jgi:hypothetical protein
LELTDNDYQHNGYRPDIIYAYEELIPAAPQQDIHLRKKRWNQPDIEQLSSIFCFVPRLCIQHTLDHTTQFAWLDSLLPLRKHFKSRLPADNVSRLNEVFATGRNFSDTPALHVGLLGHGGTTMVQHFCGCHSLLTAIYPIRREGNISSTLEAFTGQYGAPNSLSSDAKSQIGKAVREILRMYAVKDF